MAERLSWEQICNNALYVGRWIALGDARYDEVTGQTKEAAVVDADDDLAELCQRIGQSQHRNCAIVFCGSTSSHATAAIT